MSSKEFRLTERYTLLVSKRKSSRHIKLTIAPNGQVKASIPTWLPYSAAVKFAESKLDWIALKTPELKLLTNGQRIGKNHQLIFKPTKNKSITTRLADLEATVFYPESLNLNSPEVQMAAKRLVKRALKSQAEKLLPLRIDQLAKRFDYNYSGLKIKSLKTRWGSCDSFGQITLNLHLMELPWELIDYVIVHELNHTEIMQHGPKFWQALELKLPNCKLLRKQLKSYPTLT